MRFASLASSSRFGNCYLVEASTGEALLLDYGLPLRKLESALAELQTETTSVCAVYITHEHADHARALNIKYPFHVRHHVPHLLASAGTWKGLEQRGWLSEKKRASTRLTTAVQGQTITCGPFKLTSFAKQHDALEPDGIEVCCDGQRLVLLTDLGLATPAHIDILRNAGYLIVESNHDRQMELNSGRPRSLIQRVLGRYGHLSNTQAAQLISSACSPQTSCVLLAHLSLDCNQPELAVDRVWSALEGSTFRGVVAAAPAGTPSGWLGQHHDQNAAPLREHLVARHQPQQTRFEWAN